MTKLRAFWIAGLLLAAGASAALLIASASDRPLLLALPTDGSPMKSPRAVAALAGRLYALDGAGSLRVLDYEGRLLEETRLVKTVRGFPAGVTAAPDGTVLIADTHESRVRRLGPDLVETASIGNGYGSLPGQFIYPQRIALLSGELFVTEYGFDMNNRVQVFSEEGEFRRTFGGYGVTGPRFSRPADILVGPDGNLYVADASHRVLRWSPEGRYLGDVGAPGREPGRLDYPFGLATDGTFLYVAEYGTSRISRFDFEGRFHGLWAGDLLHPRDLDFADGYLFAADTGKDRIVRLEVDRIPWTEAP